MLAHLTSTAPHRTSAPAQNTAPPSPRTAALARHVQNVTVGHVYALPTVRELHRPLDATFDPRTW
jgi:hypothetical protein